VLKNLLTTEAIKKAGIDIEPQVSTIESFIENRSNIRLQQQNLMLQLAYERSFLKEK
jgi:hypothetical protein